MVTFEKENMRKMSISTKDDDLEDVTPFTVFPSIETHAISYLFDGVFLKVFGVALIFLLVYAIFLAQNFQRPRPGGERQAFIRPKKLHHVLHSVATNAVNEGALNRIAIARIDPATDNNMEFLIFVAEDNAKVEKKKDGVEKSVISPGKGVAGKVSDPFAPESRDSRLFVADIPPEYSLLLNKYFSLEEHALLVTSSWQLQSTPLSYSDLETWAWTLDQTASVGFYNSALNAGASQLHKHMQLVPLQSISKLRPSGATHALPVDDVIMPFILSNIWEPYIPLPDVRSYNTATTPSSSSSSSSSYVIHKLPQFSFVHGIAVLLDPLTWSESNKRTPPAHRLPSYSVYLKNTYRDLMASMDMRQSDCHSSGSNDRDRDRGRSRHLTHSLEGDDDFPQAERDKLRGNTGGQGGENIENEEEVEVEQPYCLAYNLILTSRWMMAVPRAEGAYEHLVTVNGLGFVGLLLARSPSALDSIHRVGPLGVLKAVALPSDISM